MLSLGTEAMHAVANSRLGAELDALWQEVIDYRDKNLTGTISFSNKTKLLTEFFYKNIAKRFMQIVWKHTGLNIEEIWFKPYFESCFCTWTCIQSTDEITARGTAQIVNSLNGQADTILNGMLLMGEANNDEFTVDQLIKLASSYDVTKGVIKKVDRDAVKRLVRVAIGFDLSLGFMMKDFLPKNAGIDNLTAREITAIMLHEIGHSLTLVEHAADMYAQISSFDALGRAFGKGLTAEKAIELGKKAGEIGLKAGYTKEASALIKVSNQAEKDLSSTSNASEKGKAMMAKGLFSASWSFIADIFTKAFDILGYDPSGMFHRGSDGKIVKYGDLPSNERMWTWQERKADEYAFTNGYGPELVEGMTKTDKFYGMIGKSAKDIEVIRRAESDMSKISLFQRLCITHAAHKLYGDQDFRSYPPGAERYKEVLRLTIKELKAHGASAEYVTKYVNDIERIARAINSMSAYDKYFDRQVMRYRLFLKYLSIPSFCKWLVDGRVDAEIEEVINDLQKVNNNMVSYFGYKLEQLAKKGK